MPVLALAAVYAGIVHLRRRDWAATGAALGVALAAAFIVLVALVALGVVCDCELRGLITGG
jgi:hypothetical protein